MRVRLLSLARQQPIALLALFVALGGSSYAAVSARDARPSGEVIQACVGKNTGRLRVVDSPIRCGSLEAPLAFNREGRRGSQGKIGPRGKRGLQGDAGPAGTPGEAGLAGTPGPQGSAGPQGPTGLQGPAGPQGDRGDTGATGPQGDQGDTGAQGPAGTNGLSISWELWSTAAWTETPARTWTQIGQQSIQVPKAGYLAIAVTFDVRNPGNSLGEVNCDVQVDGGGPSGEFTTADLLGYQRSQLVWMKRRYLQAGAHTLSLHCWTALDMQAVTASGIAVLTTS